MPKWVWGAIGLSITLVILAVAYRIIDKSSATVKVGKIFEATVDQNGSIKKKPPAPVEDDENISLAAVGEILKTQAFEETIIHPTEDRYYSYKKKFGVETASILWDGKKAILSLTMFAHKSGCGGLDRNQGPWVQIRLLNDTGHPITGWENTVVAWAVDDRTYNTESHDVTELYDRPYWNQAKKLEIQMPGDAGCD